MHFGENQLSLRSIGISPDYPQLIRAIFNLHRSGRPQALTPASPWPWVDHAVSGLLTATWRPIRTRFRSASGAERLRQLPPVTRRVIMQKARCHPSEERLQLFAGCLVSGTLSLPSRGAFHLSLTVLVRYRWRRVFSLGRWSSRIPTRFLVSRGTRVSSRARMPNRTGLSPSMVRRSRQLPIPHPDLMATTPQPRRASPPV